MSEEEKNILREARGMPSELRSLEESLTEIESRLFDAKGARRFDAGAPGTHDPDKMAEMLDRRCELEERILDARRRAADAFIRAEHIIENVGGAKKRAALRYHYLCGKTVEETAELVGVCHRTVQRYLHS